MKRTLTALITLFALLIAIAAIAQPRPRGAAPGGDRLGPPPAGMRGPGGPGGPGPILRPQALAEFLDLTDAQKSQAQALHQTLEDTVKPLFEQMRANRGAVKAAVDAGDAAAAGKALIDGDKIRDQIKAAHDQFKTSFTAILNADQKAKFAILSEIEELRRPKAPRN